MVANWASFDCIGSSNDFANCIDDKLCFELYYHINEHKVAELKILYPVSASLAY